MDTVSSEVTAADGKREIISSKVRDRIVFDVTDTDGKTGRIFLDSGDGEGIALAPSQWMIWRLQHPNAPETWAFEASPAGNKDVSGRIEYWADDLTIGPFKLTNVPVRLATPTEVMVNGPNYLASFGMYAMGKFDLAVDGKTNVVYMKQRQAPIQPYAHNRLGAIFGLNGAGGDYLVAAVIPGSPAWDAGIRDGDALLKFGQIDATKWRSDPSVYEIRSAYYQPAGTKLDLTLLRDGKEFHATPALRDILGPPPAPASPEKSEAK